MTTTGCARCQAFDVLGWLQGKGVRLKPAPAFVLRYLFENAAEIRTLDEWHDGARCAQSSLRTMLRKKGLPPPKGWLQVARLLVVRRSMLTEPTVALERLAWRIGLDHHSSLSHGFRRQFGVTARVAMGLTESDLMERWWRQRTPKRISARSMVG